MNTKLQNIVVHVSLLVSELKTNLLSVARICDCGYTVIFKEQHVVIKKIKDKVRLIADRKDDLYYLWGSDTKHNSANFSSESINSAKKKNEKKTQMLKNDTVEWIT